MPCSRATALLVPQLLPHEAVRSRLTSRTLFTLSQIFNPLHNQNLSFPSDSFSVACVRPDQWLLEVYERKFLSQGFRSLIALCYERAASRVASFAVLVKLSFFSSNVPGVDYGSWLPAGNTLP